MSDGKIVETTGSSVSRPRLYALNVCPQCRAVLHFVDCSAEGMSDRANCCDRWHQLRRGDVRDGMCDRMSIPKIPGRFKGCIGCWLGNHTHNGVGPHCPASVCPPSTGEGRT